MGVSQFIPPNLMQMGSDLMLALAFLDANVWR